MLNPLLTTCTIREGSMAGPAIVQSFNVMHGLQEESLLEASILADLLLKCHAYGWALQRHQLFPTLQAWLCQTQRM